MSDNAEQAAGWGGDSEEKHMFPCSSCGANLTFKPGADRLECEYCGNVQMIAAPVQQDTAGDDSGGGGGTVAIKEYDFNTALRDMAQRPASELVPIDLLRSARERTFDVLIAGTSTQIAADRDAYFLFSGVRIIVEEFEQCGPVIS